MRIPSVLAAAFFAVGVTGVVLADSIPQYTIVDMGVLSGDTYSQGVRISPGGIATGRSMGSTYRAFSWTQSGGLVGLPNPTSPARSYCVGNGANDDGVIVGIGATTFYGSSALPLIWQGGVVSLLPLPSGQTIGRAYDINNLGVAVGSVDAGVTERGCIYSGGVGSVITQTTSTGCYVVEAFAINDAGLVVGIAWDPANAARNVGYVLDTSTNTAFEVGGIPGCNGAICFDVSENGYVVGSSMLNQGAGTPFIWSAANGIAAIPLAAGTSQGSARGVNSAGWVVGTDSSAYAIPFVYDGTSTYRLADVLPAGSGWDLATNTSSSALSISENGVIVGTGVYNGDVHAYAMVPVAVGDLNCDGVINNFDINPFVLALTNPTAYVAAYPNCNILNADCNGDGVVNNFDINPFVALLVGG